MKKVSIILVVALTFCFIASLAFAGEATVKSVDESTGEVVLVVDGVEQTLSADKGLHLGQLKPGDKVAFEMEKGILKSIKAAEKPHQPQGGWVEMKGK